MTNAQRLAVRLSKIRQRLNEIAGLDDEGMTDEVRAEADKLTAEYQATETQHRAALVAEADEALRGRVRIAEYVGAAIDQRMAEGGVTELKPSRNAVRAVFNEEDRLRLPSLESAIRRALGMALAEGVDRAVFLGDPGANENTADIAGLTTATNVVEAEIAQADKTKGPETLAAFSGLVDGIHAMGFGDLMICPTVGSWRLWESTVINSAADSMTLAVFLRAAGLSWSARGETETATDDGDWGAFVGRGIEGAGVAVVWESGMLIRDPYVGAAKGEIALTLSHFWNFGLPRASNFARVKFAA